MTIIIIIFIDNTMELQTQYNYNSSVIVIGSTGTGKTSLINILRDLLDTDKEAGKVSKDSLACTDNIIKYGRYVDTIGFEDTSYTPDSYIYKSLLRTIRDNNWKIKAIIWMIKPEDKITPKLQTQANFINLISPEIWKNTFILVKELNVKTIPSGVQGAFAACEKYTPMNIPYWGYTIVQKDMEDISRYELSRENIKNYVLNMINNIIGEIDIVFNNVECINCGAIDDERILPETCHPNFKKIHPSKTICHSNDTKLLHGDAKRTHIRCTRKHSEGYIINKPSVGAVVTGSVMIIEGVIITPINVLVRTLLASSGIVTTTGGGTTIFLCPDCHYSTIWKGCKEECVNCHNTEKDGCVSICCICSKDYSLPGCTIVCSRCSNKLDSPGCLQKCTNCDKLIEDDNGCKTVCISCEKEKGTNGCSKVATHNIVIE